MMSVSVSVFQKTQVANTLLNHPRAHSTWNYVLNKRSLNEWIFGFEFQCEGLLSTIHC